MSIERQLEAKHNRRMTAEDRFLSRIEKREDHADMMIGALCRDGKHVFYVFPVGGKYKEGSRLDLISYLIRNNYV